MRALNHLARLVVPEQALRVETQTMRLRQVMCGMIVIEAFRRYDTMTIHYLVDDPERFPKTPDGEEAPVYRLNLEQPEPEVEPHEQEKRST